MSGNRGQGGIAIYDVTNLLKPKVLKQNYLKFPVHNTFACQMGSKAYMLVVDDVNARDVHIIDISKPQSPREIAVTGAPDWPAAVDNIYPAMEGTFTEPSYSLPGGAFAGPIVWTGGQGCTAGEIPPAPAADAVALIQRGTCFFQDKAESAEAQGYAGFVVANDAARGDGLVSMSARDNGPYPPIPGYFVGFSTGEVMKAAGVGSLGAMLDVHGVFDGWGYMRVLDTSDPTNPVEIGQYATEGVLAQPPPPGNHRCTTSSSMTPRPTSAGTPTGCEWSISAPPRPPWRPPTSSTRHRSTPTERRSGPFLGCLLLSASGRQPVHPWQRPQHRALDLRQALTIP